MVAGDGRLQRSRRSRDPSRSRDPLVRRPSSGSWTWTTTATSTPWPRMRSTTGGVDVWLNDGTGQFARAAIHLDADRSVDSRRRGLQRRHASRRHLVERPRQRSGIPLRCGCSRTMAPARSRSCRRSRFRSAASGRGGLRPRRRSGPGDRHGDGRPGAAAQRRRRRTSPRPSRFFAAPDGGFPTFGDFNGDDRTDVAIATRRTWLCGRALADATRRVPAACRASGRRRGAWS